MDRISDTIIRIKNAQLAGHDVVRVLPNRLIKAMLVILKDLGYIRDFHSIKEGQKESVDVFLKYDERDKPVISEFKRVSKSSLRVYDGSKEIPRIANGYATVLVSTSQGLKTGKSAKESGLGGEIIAYIM